MQWFKDLRTSTKLLLSFSIIILIMLFILSMLYSTVSSLDKNNMELNNKDLIVLESIALLKDEQGDSQNILLGILINSKPEELPTLINALKIKLENEKRLIQTISLSGSMPDHLQKKVTSIVQSQAELENLQMNQMLPLISTGKLEEAQLLEKAKGSQLYKQLSDLTSELFQGYREKINSSIIELKNEVNRITQLFIGFSILVVLLGLGLVWLLNRLIVTPLKEISLAAKRIAAGDLTIEVMEVGKRKDEFGALANTFQKMITSLRNFTQEISEGIISLEASATQISTATVELSSSSSETATAISQTTTTIEEVKQTSQVANQKAKFISESSQKSNEVSQSGKKAANEINVMTNNIQTQMNLIAESMLRLSEQSQAIGNIITAVEDMAQQSNLLSVNASIEAAKAGEQGKGFAIVAQEVKTLASQSKQATNQVKDILNDIQKATNSAVMATEQGSKSVDLAVKKSKESNESILSLVNTVSNSSKDAMQIAATAHQQMVGMEQLAVAMENIKQATFQNVEGSKQLELAAHSIKELGQKLKQLISMYRLK